MLQPVAQELQQLYGHGYPPCLEILLELNDLTGQSLVLLLVLLQIRVLVDAHQPLLMSEMNARVLDQAIQNAAERGLALTRTHGGI